MSGSVTRRPQARRDLVELADHIPQNSPAAAERFLDAAEETFTLLASMPQIGSPWESEEPQLAHLRYVPIKGFKNHLIFYFPLPDGIEVVRFLHASRDIQSILQGE